MAVDLHGYGINEMSDCTSKTIPFTDNYQQSGNHPLFHSNGQSGNIIQLESLPQSVFVKLDFHDLHRLISQANEGMKRGVKPKLADGAMGGTYFLRDSFQSIVVVCKPGDEEPNSPHNPYIPTHSATGWGASYKGRIVPGFGMYREVAAYVLDNNFSGVPPTQLARVHEKFLGDKVKTDSSPVTSSSPISEYKICSVQSYVRNICSAEDMGPTKFTKEDVQRIAVFDIRVCNLDRHEGNLLVNKEASIYQKRSRVNSELDTLSTNITTTTTTNTTIPSPYNNYHDNDEDENDMSMLDTIPHTYHEEKYHLIPIDHGYILPHILSMSDPSLAWVHWAQADEPLSPNIQEYIESLDYMKDADLLRRVVGAALHETSLLTLQVCTLYLKIGVKYGLSLRELGMGMCPDFNSGPAGLNDKELPKSLLQKAVYIAIHRASLHYTSAPYHLVNNSSNDDSAILSHVYGSSPLHSPKVDRNLLFKQNSCIDFIEPRHYSNLNNSTTTSNTNNTTNTTTTTTTAMNNNSNNSRLDFPSTSNLFSPHTARGVDSSSGSSGSNSGRSHHRYSTSTMHSIGKSGTVLSTSPHTSSLLLYGNQYLSDPSSNPNNTYNKSMNTTTTTNSNSNTNNSNTNNSNNGVISNYFNMNNTGNYSGRDEYYPSTSPGIAYSYNKSSDHLLRNTHNNSTNQQETLNNVFNYPTSYNNYLYPHMEIHDKTDSDHESDTTPFHTQTDQTDDSTNEDDMEIEVEVEVEPSADSKVHSYRISTSTPELAPFSHKAIIIEDTSRLHSSNNSDEVTTGPSISPSSVAALFHSHIDDVSLKSTPLSSTTTIATNVTKPVQSPSLLTRSLSTEHITNPYNRDQHPYSSHSDKNSDRPTPISTANTTNTTINQYDNSIIGHKSKSSSSILNLIPPSSTTNGTTAISNSHINILKSIHGNSTLVVPIPGKTSTNGGYYQAATPPSSGTSLSSLSPTSLLHMNKLHQSKQNALKYPLKIRDSMIRVTDNMLVRAMSVDNGKRLTYEFEQVIHILVQELIELRDSNLR